MWKTRNRACFENVMPYDPIGVVFQICHWIEFCSELQKTEVEKALRQGARMLKMVAAEIFNRYSGWAPLCRRILT